MCSAYTIPCILWQYHVLYFDVSYNSKAEYKTAPAPSLRNWRYYIITPSHRIRSIGNDHPVTKNTTNRMHALGYMLPLISSCLGIVPIQCGVLQHNLEWVRGNQVISQPDETSVNFNWRIRKTNCPRWITPYNFRELRTILWFLFIYHVIMHD